MIVLFAVVVSLILVYVFYKNKTEKKTIPEGLKELPLEKGFPILGILPQIESPLPIYLTKLGRKHGPLFRIRLGMRDIVVLNDFETIKKALKESGDIFSGRIQLEVSSVITRNSGILLTDGERWIKQRSFLLTVLRDFGLGKAKTEDIVQSECDLLLEELRKTEGESVDFADLIPVYTANIISKFISRERFSRTDPKLRLIEDLIQSRARRVDLVLLLHLMFPIMDKSKTFCKFILAITSKWKRSEKIYSYFRSDIEDHRKRLDLKSKGEDLIDRFLIKQHELKERTGDVDTFTEWQLIRISLELFLAGYETTSTTMGWSLLFMARFPDIQERVYQEIVDKIGKERMAAANDRKSLNYTQAVMDEMTRLASVVPLSLAHRTLQNTSVNGYFIPKDSLIFPNLLGCHTDPNIWEDPMEFKPDRFLSVDSNGEVRYCPREELIAFSMGKRQCLGESLARMEYLIFFVSILQNFKVRFSETIGDRDYEEVLRGNNGFIRFSKIKDFVFTARH